MLAALTWIPRGAATAKLPVGVDDSPDDPSMQLSATDHDMPLATDRPPKHTSTDESDSDADADADDLNDDDPDDNDADADLDDADDNAEVDIDEVLANDLDALAFHKRGEKDPYLSSDPNADALFDDEDLEALNLKPTDSLIIAAKSGEDASTLEVHLFDDDPDASDDDDSTPDDSPQSHAQSGPGVYVPHHYIHHDLVLPALPLCAAYTRISLAESTLNLVAVGMFTPGIDVWDVDRVNHLEPVVALGGYADAPAPPAPLPPGRTRTTAAAAARSRKKKKKPKLRLRDGSHSDAVMALSWNAVQHEYLASGSADTTVKVWDVESAHCATTLRHHTDKVQAVEFHPREAHLVATGAFDRTVQVVDVRAQDGGGGGGGEAARSWTLGGDVEAAQWSHDGTLVFATAEDGRVSVFDTRKDGRQSRVAEWAAHNGPASACSVSSDVPGLMVTAGVDKLVKVWDVGGIAAGSTDRPELVYQRGSRIGALFALALCPLPAQKECNASPFVVAFGGAKGNLGVMDLAVESELVRRRFRDRCPAAALAVIEARAARGTRQMNARRQKKKDVDEDTPDEEEGRHGGSGDDSGDESS